MAAKKENIEHSFGRHLPEIHRMGPHLFEPTWAERMHRTHGCELLHVISNTLTLVSDKERYTAGPGETLLVPSGQMHRDEFDPSRELEIFFCVFSWELEKEYFALVDNRVLLGMSAIRKAELSTMFDHLRGDLAGISEADRLVARVRLLAILLLVLREAMEKRTPDRVKAEERDRRRSQDLMKKAKTYMEKHYAEPIGLDDIASALDISAYHLSHIFSRESDFSLFAYLTALRMEKARVLLRAGRHNVSEAAFAVGYEDPNYFSKVFRKHCGCSPREFSDRHPV